MLRTALLSALAGLVIAADWLRLEDPQRSAGRAAALVAIAIVPALVRPLWLRAAAAIGAALAAAAIAFSVSLLAVVPGGEPFFAPIYDRFTGGFVDFYEFRLPVDPLVHGRIHMVILIAVFAFTFAVALAVGARRPVLAVAAFLVGAGWPSTLLSGGNALGRGAVILLGALALLAGLSDRAGRFALPAVGTVLLGAVALAASPAVAKTAFVDWQHWNPYVRPVKPVSVSYVWDARYTGIHFPRKVTTMLTIRAPETIGTYWRATALDAFEGDRWIERLWRETPLESHELDPPGARTTEHFVQQDITVDGLADNHLVAASLPIVFNVSEPTLRAGQNVGMASDGLKRGQRYIAWSYTAEPTAQQLVGSRPVYPAVLTRPGSELEVSPNVTAPPFGVPGRDALLDRRLAGSASAPYARLLARARQVVGDTRSPYAATVALERWFRTTGGFSYSTQPPATPGLPPLVGFVLNTQTGYCQHFAGAMAVMLRLLGVPARVAVGFVRGKYRDGVWVITDHDAHAWVEVWFRGFGWLPFDPTPGRGRLAAPYSSTSARFDPAAEARLLSGVVRGGEVFGATGRTGDSVRLPSVRSAADVGVRGLLPAKSPSHHHSLVRFLLLLALGLVAAISFLKLVRRRARYLTRDPRRIAAACGRELSEFLLDQRLPVRRGASFGDLQHTIGDSLAVDAASFARAADAARFGPPVAAREAAVQARRELRELKRRLRRQLFVLDRARGLVSLRSFGFS